MQTELERRRDRMTSPAQGLEGVVSSPPLDENGWLRVELEAQPGFVKVCPYQSRALNVVDPSGPGTWLVHFLQPKAGDGALVLESDAGNYWCVCWWPQ